VIKEVDELDQAMEMMKATINRFIVLINSLAGEQDLETLLDQVTDETMHIIDADAMLVYLLDDKDDRYHARVLKTRSGSSLAIDTLPSLQLQQIESLAGTTGQRPRTVRLSSARPSPLSMLTQLLDSEQIDYVPVALANRNGDVIGLLLYAFTDVPARIAASNIDFVTALSGFAAVTLESRQLIRSQEALLDAFIRLFAGAIDAKSPYTGGHCQRVPELTRMLAQAACDSDSGPYRDFSLDSEQWEALHIAAWLHDCGKVTTPEYVVDKSTKLETIYDRIHEIRMRFEVLKRDAEIACWKSISNGGDRDSCFGELSRQLSTLDDEFAFIAKCNEGGEFMSDEDVGRVQQIAGRTWQRTLDDRLGISWEEDRRKARQVQQALPVEEPLLADKPEHLMGRDEADRMPGDNPWGFRLDVPEYKYNRGEIYNLCIRRGTLSAEERYKINDHIVQTIIMLDKLPYPKHLKTVPDIAGGHHEKMDGTGYPRRLQRDDMSVTARMMAIADIYEALTASDRPYKKAKTVSEALKIMSLMCKDQHIDPELFELFLEAGIYKQYAEQFLPPEQLDSIDITQYLQ
jgi:HD-GYP domain-containing protein (c-di-GMP phosphodiesterase class II)